MANEIKKYNGNGSGKKSNTGLWIGLAVLVAGAGLWLYYRNAGKREAKKEDEITEDLDDFETAQAVELKGLIGASKTLGVWTTNGEIITASTKAHIKILNVMLAVVDWPKLQKKFRALCDGEFTLTDALNKCLTDADYQQALKFAAAKKVVTTTTYQRGKTYPANTVMGVLNGEGKNMIGNKTYLTINEITTNWNGTEDTEVIIDVPQDMAKIVNPV